MNNDSVNRRTFVQKFMDRGLTYAQACQIYEAMVGVFEDAVVAGTKINIGRVLSLAPVVLEPRVVSMGFKRKKNAVEKTTKTFYLGRRLKYKVNIYREFVNTHSLNWFS